MIPREVFNIIEEMKSSNLESDVDMGICAARAFLTYAEEFGGSFPEEFLEGLQEIRSILEEIRPSSIVISNTIKYIFKRLEGNDINTLRESVIRSSTKFIENSKRAIEMIGRICSERIESSSTIMTNGNFSTVLSALVIAARAGKNIEVYVAETRPYLEGHLFVRQLEAHDISAILILDSAMRYFMKEVDIVIAGAKSVASNGAVISKVGTSLMALCAYEARVPFIVCAETYRFSPETVIGKLVKIEEGDPKAIADPTNFKKVKIRNPSYDATPPEYVDAIITERGVISPYLAYEIIRDEFGVNL